ncbi:MAG: 30S ribosomal protein S6 [Victivallales bacterium]|nr:30S ribosomal protein S6 [Victivallales bacterium]
MSKYEVVFILDPQKVEGNGEAFEATIQEQLKALGGEISRVKFLEKRTFARPMGKHKVGLYWDYVVTMGQQAPRALKDKYKLNDKVIRLAVFKYEDGQDDEVFKPRDARIFGDESFQDEYENDNYRYRGSRASSNGAAENAGDEQ